jgi:predicted small metal-binding protein
VTSGFSLRDLRLRSCFFGAALEFSAAALDSQDNWRWRKLKMPQDMTKGPQSERNPGQSNQNLAFRCADVGQNNCNWQASGKSEDELLPKIEQHAKEVHHMNMDENTRSKVKGAIRRQAA